MKYGRELELEIIAFIERNTGPADTDGIARYEIVPAMNPQDGSDHRNIEQALSRLVKKGELIEERETDANGLPHYHLPGK